MRELPDLLPGERLILHVKGTEAETKELPKDDVRAAIYQGTITQSQLIWIPQEHAWKQDIAVKERSAPGHGASLGKMAKLVQFPLRTTG